MASFLGSSSTLYNHLVGPIADYDADDIDYLSDFDEDQYDFEEDQYDFDNDDDISSNTSKNVVVSEIPHECCICFTSFDEELEYLPSKCGHYLCTLCLNYYVDIALKNKVGFMHPGLYKIIKIDESTIKMTRAFGIKCPITSCKHILTDKDLTKLVDYRTVRKIVSKGEDEFEKYMNSCSYCFTAKVKDLCPNTLCNVNRQIQNQRKEHQQSYFYKPPSTNKYNWIDIDLIKKSWTKKNMAWSVHSDVRMCPKCCEPIEKNGGCSHMHCYKCNCDFLWDNSLTMEMVVKFLMKSKDKKIKKVLRHMN